jgi:hypothetical protein
VGILRTRIDELAAHFPDTPLVRRTVEQAHADVIARSKDAKPAQRDAPNAAPQDAPPLPPEANLNELAKGTGHSADDLFRSAG